MMLPRDVAHAGRQPLSVQPRKMIAVLFIAALIFGTTRFAIGDQRSTRLNAMAIAYDNLQQSYEACLIGDSQPRFNPPFKQVADESPMESVQQQTRDYVNATLFLRQAFSVCQEGHKDAVYCWGFWPPDTSGDLHWKLMPCEG